MSWGYYPRFPTSRPKAARGGIKSQSKRGKFGESWWAKRWIAVLESFNIGARLGRGRTYARSGQVLSINIEKGLVKASVQGSRSTPYAVTMKVTPISKADWLRLAKALSSQVIFAAKLLAGEMPQDIEDAFKGAGLSLFPERLKDLKTDCSCPDWSNPCKHIAAVYYLLGEEFDRNPFLIFELRGMSREELVSNIGSESEGNESEAKVEARKTKGKGGRAKREAAEIREEAPAPPEPPISPDPSSFWNGADLPEDILGDAPIPRMTAAVVKRLGSFPFWRSDRSLMEIVEPVYWKASQRGMDVFLGEAGTGDDKARGR